MELINRIKLLFRVLLCPKNGKGERLPLKKDFICSHRQFLDQCEHYLKSKMV